MKVCELTRLNDFIRNYELIGQDDFIKIFEVLRLDNFFRNYEVVKVYDFMKCYGLREKN